MQDEKAARPTLKDLLLAESPRAEIPISSRAKAGAGGRPESSSERSVPFNVTLAELLAQVAGAELSFRREADLFGVSVLVLPEGRQMLLIERIYRDGTGVLLDPTPEEVEIARVGELGQIWNSERRSLLSSEIWNWDVFDE
jgi:hypothetical protein